MGDKIDRRSYAKVLLRHSLWIVTLALVAAGAAFVVSLSLPPTYEAPALVLITGPRYQLQFDSRLGTEQTTPAYGAFPALAASDGILQAVVDAYQPSPQALGGKEWNLEELKGMVEAASEGDPSLVVLRVTSGSPWDAAAVANAWADILVAEGNEFYGGTETDLAFFESQLVQARAALDRTEAALVDFEAGNEAWILQAELDSLRQSQTDCLAQQREIAFTIQNIQGLRQQLAEQPARTRVSLGESLTALVLQMQAFDALAASPVQLQLASAAALSDKSLAEQVEILDGLVDTLETKSSAVDARLVEVEPRMLSLQRRLQQSKAEAARLAGEQDLAQETYVTLARKVNETRIATQEEKGILQVGSYASVPGKAVGPPKLIITAVAGMLGLLAGVVGAFALDSWRQKS